MNGVASSVYRGKPTRTDLSKVSAAASIGEANVTGVGLLLHTYNTTTILPLGTAVA
jgi:hypothetical protein